MTASARDKEIGLTVARLRGSRSQQSVAELMKEREFRWSQATVWKVERGERPLRLTEAEALAEVLQCPLAELLGVDTAADDVIVIRVQEWEGFLEEIDSILQQNAQLADSIRTKRASTSRASKEGKRDDGQHPEAT